MPNPNDDIDLLQIAFNRLMDTEPAQRAVNSFTQFLDRLGSRLDGSAPSSSKAKNTGKRSAENKQSNKKSRLNQCYRALKLEPGASVEEAKRARRQLLKKYHPDLYQDPKKREIAARMSARINAAYDYIIKMS